MADLKNIIYIGNEDYETLVSTGTVTINGDTLTYDPDNVYVTPDDAVTLSESQTITGKKTFSTSPVLSNNVFVKGLSTTGVERMLVGIDSNNSIYLGDANQGLVLRTSGNVLPSANSSKNLGSSSYKWKDLYLSGNLSDGTNSVTIAQLATAANLSPMVFKGTLGTNGSITTLPAASSSNNGFTYKVITAGTYQSLACEVGDTVISNGSSWVLIPSGDEEQTTDTWRDVKVNDVALLGNAITTGSLNFKDSSKISVSGSGNDVSFNLKEAYVTTGTAQNIDGQKTIIGQTRIKGSAAASSADNTTSGFTFWKSTTSSYSKTSEDYLGLISANDSGALGIYGRTALFFRPVITNGSVDTNYGVTMNNTGLFPGSDSMPLGNSDHPWNNVWVKNLKKGSYTYTLPNLPSGTTSGTLYVKPSAGIPDADLEEDYATSTELTTVENKIAVTIPSVSNGTAETGKAITSLSISNGQITATKDSFLTPESLANYVNRSTAQEIGGVKTFSSRPNFSVGAISTSTAASPSNGDTTLMLERTSSLGLNGFVVLTYSTEGNTGTYYQNGCIKITAAGVQNPYELTLPNKSGTIATMSDLPTKVSDLTNDSGFVQSSSLATVATSGSYNDLIDKPTITTNMVDGMSNVVCSPIQTTKLKGAVVTIERRSSAVDTIGVEQNDAGIFNGSGVWTDGESIYFSGYNRQKMLVNGQWQTKTWSGISSEILDGSHICRISDFGLYGPLFLNGSHQYILSNGEWASLSTSNYFDFSSAALYGKHIWKTKDGRIYHSYGSTQQEIKYDSSRGKWKVYTKTWNINEQFYGFDIWTDGVNIYLSCGSNRNYILVGDNWVSVSWKNLTNKYFYGRNVWTDGVNIYGHTQPNSSSNSIVDTYVFVGNDWKKITRKYQDPTESPLTYMDGQNVWTDGKNVYYTTGTWVIGGKTRKLYHSVDYGELENTPTIPTVSTAGITGSYTDLTDKPYIPQQVEIVDLRSLENA